MVATTEIEINIPATSLIILVNKPSWQITNIERIRVTLLLLLFSNYTIP